MSEPDFPRPLKLLTGEAFWRCLHARAGVAWDEEDQLADPVERAKWYESLPRPCEYTEDGEPAPPSAPLSRPRRDRSCVARVAWPTLEPNVVATQNKWAREEALDAQAAAGRQAPPVISPEEARAERRAAVKLMRIDFNEEGLFDRVRMISLDPDVPDLLIASMDFDGDGDGEPPPGADGAAEADDDGPLRPAR